jgi:peptidoglycan/xylan/chitin deacetylase (PgdA/CDA1 family)
VALAAVSVDLDEIHNYERLHGVRCPGAAHAVLDLAVPRAVELAARHGIPLTFFAVGADLDRAAAREALAEATRRGHVVENHSLRHRYDLTRLGRDAMRAEVEGGADAIEAATGRRSVGFRAPGYTVSDELFDVLEASGVRFDSSVLSSPPYYLVKCAVLASMRVRGRPSAAILDRPTVLLSPRAPYRPGRPYWRRGDRWLVELPIGVSPWLGVPILGSSVGLAGRRWAPALARSWSRQPFVHLELHGLDFLDASDGLAPLVPRQPELRAPLATRLEALSAVLDLVAAAGAEPKTLADVAEALTPPRRAGEGRRPD